MDGLTDSGPTNGRYIGRRSGGLSRLSFARPAVTSTARMERGSSNCEGPQRFPTWYTATGQTSDAHDKQLPSPQGRLRNGEPIEVTFDAELASGRGVELLSVRHQLVSLAVDHLEGDGLRLRRFGFVEVPALPPGSRFALEVDIATEQGVRLTHEMWATAVDITSGESAPDVGPAFMSALAGGELKDPQWCTASLSNQRVEDLKNAVWERRAMDEPQRKAESEAVTRARLQARRQSLLIKIQKAQTTLSTVQERERDPRIIRMAEGRVRNVTQDLERLNADLTKPHESRLPSVQ